MAKSIKKKSEKEGAVRASGRIFIPKTHREDAQTFVAVNGKNAVIRNGEPVVVPAALAWAVRDSQREAAKAEKYAMENAKN